MTLIELLQQIFNASEEQTTAFSNAMKENKIFTTSEENMDTRYGKLKAAHETATTQLGEANKTIEALKKSTKGQEEAQQKIADYETQIATLQQQLEQAQIDADVHVELLSAGVKPDDIDYVMYKLKAKGELQRGEDGKIRDMDDKIAALKTQLPAQFSSGSKKQYQEHKLEKEDPPAATVTREDFNKMGYNSRVQLRQENPELYDQMMKG